MFCDLVGSTAISEQLDPEEMARLLTRLPQDLLESGGAVWRVHRQIHGRRVADLLRLPPRAGRRPTTCNRSESCEIVSAVEAMNGDGAGSGRLLRVRIGINTGLVVTGEIGTGGLHEKMAIVGDTPNIAARLQSLAEPGTVSDRWQNAPPCRRLFCL